MNNLSLYLYLSDVFPSLGPIFYTLGWGGLLLTVGWRFAAFLTADDHCPCPKPPFVFWFLSVFIFLGALMPSTPTMRLMAASEFGERVVKSARVQGIVDPGLQYVEKWLKEHVKD